MSEYSKIQPMRQASATFETAVVKTDEFVMLCEAGVANGSTVEEAYEDAKMIDHLLHMKHLHLVVHGEVKKTKAGYFRKSTGLFDSFERIIESRLHA